MQNSLLVSSSPHLRDSQNTARIMWLVVLSLLPALLGSVYFFGWAALKITSISVISCMITEAVIQNVRGKKISLFDGSAVITGILLAFCLPPGIPWWLPAVGGLVAIGIGKQAFGGLGHNLFNPALVGRAFLLASWPVLMTTKYLTPEFGADALTSATPLGTLKSALAVGAGPERVKAALEVGSWPNIAQFFIGRMGGSIGETSVLLLLVGAAMLYAMKLIDWRIPIPFIGVVMLFGWIFGGPQVFTGQPLVHLLSGGLVLGAFFMATDMVTSPMTSRGKIVFGLGCGLLTAVIRIWGGYPEGVSYSILLMNGTAPLIDRYTQPRKFGVPAGS